MPDRLDRYVSGYFLSSYGMCLLFFVGMFVLVDLFGNIEDILEHAPRLRALGYSISDLAIGYYALLLPFIFLQLAPFVTAMGAMFALTRLRRNNEIVPMISAGRSVYRIVAPIFVFAVLAAVVMVVTQEYLAPRLAGDRERLEKLLFRAKEERLLDARVRCGPDTFVFVRDYDPVRRTIASFDVSVLTSDKPPIVGSGARWDERRRRFVWEEKRPDGEGGFFAVVRELPETLTPELIEAQSMGPYDLSYSQAEFLWKRTGEPRWKVLLHYHLTFPLANVLLLLLCLPFVLQQHTRSVLLGMVIALLICAAYFTFDAVMRNLGEKEVIHPVLASWFGVVFFGSLGIVLIDGVRT